MNIIEPKYTWNGTLTKRSLTSYLILHHAAGYGSPEDIHAYHKGLGWLGIAYHYYVRLDGSIHRGRPENTSGGHTTNYNYCSIGICAEGNFQVDTMPEAQRNALAWLVSDIKTRYPNISVKRHKEFQNTSCPGANYPFDSIVSGALVIPSPTPIPTTNHIKTFQTWLNGNYGSGLVIDGIYGAKTKAAAIKAYQMHINATYKAGLAVDGIWGAKTKAAVRTMQRGDTSNQVRILQGMLHCYGYDCGTIDGIFGYNTYNALLGFQKKAGIAVDGLAGKNTMAKLFS